MSRMKPRQLPLAMPYQSAMSREDFVVGEGNREAAAFIDAWPDWPASVVLLIGPNGSGKTHLVNIWATKSRASVVAAADLASADPTALVGTGAVAIEDADDPALDENALFHLLNAARGRGASVLITAHAVPSVWGVTLPDLLSRLRAAQPAFLGPPDDALLEKVIVKLLADRQLAIDAGVLDYILLRMERSCAAACALVEALDRESLARGRRITRAIAAEVLAPEGEA
ncbi:DnaA regulatory inactivator Hda [Pleomorphomonas sp. T1.2MG-36]|uniref:HdaA/DnaA family protein n=1 Tax=Pleomorphomonas sp. T1.2MG-36 TaxID=3041167 RepID=UPI002477A860|nr:DnaA regulatory inactivator Hda [Pleomorphomonas sp. T1.2MG-36]